MFGDALTIVGLIGGVLLFFYVMAKINTSNVGGHGAIVVLSLTMTIALAPAMAYEKYRKIEERAKYEELMKYIKSK